MRCGGFGNWWNTPESRRKCVAGSITKSRATPVAARPGRLGLAGQDVYANVIGGMRVAEPAADLAVALAIASSFRDRPLDPQCVAIGEVGLAGRRL